MRAFLSGVAVFGPGLPGWAASEAMLAGTAPWTMAEALPPVPAVLAPANRRRASAAVRFALAAADDASAEEPDRAALETIFASGNGDGAVVGGILDALHAPDEAVSPTLFHNSVHNAAAGYWHIAVGSTRPSLSLGGHDGAFAAGLLAAMTAAAHGRPVLLVAYDTPLPSPLAAKRPTGFAFATACVLRPDPGGARAELALRYLAGPLPAAAPGDALDALAEGNPAARALPLLRALAARRAALVRLPLLEDAHLELQVSPC
ncbi:beta-ketoacyl synthase chain length factor [Siccirubricoccus sp. KC 17139]|uniref:Beta-ketoacyl synthase chain length factor n=1 Tax=Siccirubricoccus soli TaxID=2899147 RepID=A0ABT1D7X1_9PROT|nr:beta-ketoacyl synthase chain length factor [Siccirubricoccus soli]MCO6418006.1 beta-ketoacyl synthase chain length factor [Siccirubricoccus soli]MCP2684141.1 beta-ketoacyl synthase chain length factor [Siccirubricoccus soli]